MEKEIVKAKVNAEIKKRAQIVAIEQSTTLSKIVEKALALYLKRYYDNRKAPNLQAITDVTQQVLREQSQKFGGTK